MLSAGAYEKAVMITSLYAGARKIQIEDKLDQIHKELLKETRGVPFIMPFTFGEYGFCEHSSNICGGLMLSYVVLCRK